MEQIIEETVAALRRGGTILYPTDTIWGIGCDARNSDAVRRLYAIKERDPKKSMLVLCTESIVAAGDWRAVSSEWMADRPTTYIVPAKVWQPMFGQSLAEGLAAADGSLGIRMVRHEFCRRVIDALGAPLVSTSANLSGQPSPASFNEISDELRRRIDYCVPPLPQFESHETRGSRIVKLSPDGELTIIRP